MPWLIGFFFFGQLCIPMTPFWDFLCIEEEKWGTTFIHVPILSHSCPEFANERNLYEIWKVGELEKPVFSAGHCKPRVDSWGTLCLMHFAVSSWAQAADSAAPGQHSPDVTGRSPLLSYPRSRNGCVTPYFRINALSWNNSVASLFLNELCYISSPLS